ncbi:site-specific recombinase [Thioalkalivibrio paradoxus]|uniref:Recombinase n=1 Tax=Thioalkalivibrio paradoxus ARh 1 TaxID=713585 RepID=W0DJW4_9GAMM|nr:site-specific recombinase [Thioalkalivibrio paradoxus]AHE98736.1 recombinase [Thioalkalivibrio paradoxus ARh 1]
MNTTTADSVLARLADDEDRDLADTLRLLVDWLRPAPHQRHLAAPVIARIEELVVALRADPGRRQVLRERLEQGLESARHLTLYTGIGLFSRRGFLRELVERMYERVNPRPMERRDLKDVLAYVFHQPSDADWVSALPDDAWWRLFEALGCGAEEHPVVLQRARDEILYALEMLSMWIAAEELEPELLRLDPSIAERNSAFVAQQRELGRFIEAYRAWLTDPSLARHDDRHARVLLDQCREQIARLRRRAVTRGSSVSLTHLLERLDQTLARIERLLDMLDPSDPTAARSAWATLFRELVAANTRRYSVRTLWQENIGLLSRSVTQRASETGEHYITQNRAEYLEMFRSGAGAGLIIALMALIKIQVEALDLAAGAQTFWVSMNYGLGFVLIHILHFTVATKQPAMTAARLAAAIEESDRGTASPAKLADLLIQVGRSQFIAVLGNVSIALPVAVLVGWLYALALGSPVLTPQGVEYQLHQLSPVAGLALFHAAIAGVWLFVAGLISGFFDNRCAYLELPDRLRGHPLLRRLLSERKRDRLANFVAHNYGALFGNFLFGVLLGVTGYIGYLLSLPLDIRHVAFASANLGYATAVQMPGVFEWLFYLVLVLLIGAVNLWVSFGLALYVALKARGTRIGALDRVLKAYARRIRERPREFLLPPAQVREASDASGKDRQD